MPFGTRNAPMVYEHILVRCRSSLTQPSFPSAEARGSPPSVSLPFRGKNRLCCGTRPLGRFASNGLKQSSHSGRSTAAESSRRAAGNYFSAGLPKNQFPLRCPQPPPLVSSHAATGPAFLPPPGCRRLSSSWPTKVGHFLLKPPAPASFASRAVHSAGRKPGSGDGCVLPLPALRGPVSFLIFA